MMRTRKLVLGTLALAGALGSTRAWAQCYVDSQQGDDQNDGMTENTPVRTQSAIPSGCTEVRYAHGSVFNEAVATGGSGFGASARSVFAAYGDPNLPAPKFVVESGSVVSGFGGGITVDGLYLAGSRGDGTMQGLIGGVCVMLGSNSRILNNEITDCDIGIMLSGEGSLVRGNVIHDLNMAVDSTNPDVYANSVGGAEGIFVNGSNNEVAYNTFFNCADAASWTGGNCDGGATEVAVGQDAVVENVRVHHNLSYDTCGFFEVSGFGVFRNSEFFYNLMIDSGWMMLLQVNETTLENISWTNNTAVHHAAPANDTITPAVTMIYRAEVTPGTVFMTNNLVVFEAPGAYLATIDQNIDQANNLLLVGTDPGFVNLGGKTAEDFDLLAGSQAIDAGQITAYELDFLNRTVPGPSGIPDIGAFEHGSAEGAPRPDVAVPDGAPGTAPTNTDSSGSGEEEGGCSCTVRARRTSVGWLTGLLVLGACARPRRVATRWRR